MGKQYSPEPIQKTKILLVEGKDEENLFNELLKQLYLNDDIQVIEIGGKDKFPDRIKYLKDVSEFSMVVSIGITRDADSNPRDTFQSVCSGLLRVDLPVPTAPLQPIANHPQVTIMIVPSIDEQGMIENVCLDSVHDDPAMECVEQFFECLKSRHRTLDENDVPKSRVRMYLTSREWLEIAHFEYLQQCMENYEPIVLTSPAVAVTKVHAFLASRYTPDLDLGIAARKSEREDRYWNFNHPSFYEIKRFLQML